MRKSVHLILFLLVAGFFGGCAYTEDRVMDLTDILHAKVTVGEGIDLSGRVPWMGLGLGYSKGISAGFAYRGIGVWKSERTDIQILLPYMHREEEDGFEALAGSITRYGVGDRGLIEKWPPGGSEFEFERLVAAKSYESYLRFGVTLQFFLGADVEVRPVEAVDFILGIFTVDFRKDDTAGETK